MVRVRRLHNVQGLPSNAVFCIGLALQRLLLVATIPFGYAKAQCRKHLGCLRFVRQRHLPIYGAVYRRGARVRSGQGQ